jgi:predicted transcriptional regulator
MARTRPRPTDSELAILRILWERGPSTVRDVHEAMSSRQTGYTSTLKLMQIMTEKGLVTRDDSARTHVYKAHFRREEAQRALVNDLVQLAFGGSAAALAMHAISAHPATAEELREIQDLIARHRKGNR